MCRNRHGCVFENFECISLICRLQIPPLVRLLIGTLDKGVAR